MKLREIMEEASAGASTSGAVATVAQPLGELQRRIPEPVKLAKYSNGPAKDYAAPRKNKHAR
jgi:hypothetical protein